LFNKNVHKSTVGTEHELDEHRTLSTDHWNHIQQNCTLQRVLK